MSDLEFFWNFLLLTTQIILWYQHNTRDEDCEAVKNSLQCVTHDWDPLVCSHKTADICSDNASMRADTKRW